MFNGLIKCIAKVRFFDGKYLDLLVDKNALNPDLGDSIAVNGACLSVVKMHDCGFCVEVGAKSREILALERFNVGNLVHLEEAMRLNQRIDGHLMQGHIDFSAKIKSIKKNDNVVEMEVFTPKKQLKFIAKKGSVAIDGVSLTVNEVFDDSFSVGLIPITFENTIFKGLSVGDRVHIETDLFAKYTINYLTHLEEIKTHNKTKNDVKFYMY